MNNQTETKILAPSAGLGRIVKFYMIFRCQLDRDQTLISFPLPPAPSHFLCFYTLGSASIQYIADDQIKPQHSTVIVGPNDKTFYIHLPKTSFIIRVILHSGALYRLSGIPMTELLNKNNFESTCILPGMEQINDQLGSLKSDKEAIHLIEKFIYSKISKKRDELPFDLAMNVLIKSGGSLSFEKLADMSCLSYRQLERQCIMRIGYNPKYVGKMARFFRAWSLKEQYPNLDWNSISYHCNYYDLQHLRKDFYHFSGFSPKIATEQINHIPIDLKNQLIFD